MNRTQAQIDVRRHDYIVTPCIIIAVLACVVGWIITGLWWTMLLIPACTIVIIGIGHATAPRGIDEKFLIREQRLVEQRRRASKGRQ